MKNSLEKAIAFYFLLSFLFLPLTFNGKDWQFRLTQFFFGKLIKTIQHCFFSEALSLIDFSSDTISLNLLLLILLLIAISMVLFLNIAKIKNDKIVLIGRVAACYYISFILLKYGFDKIFKAQFYVPEPNILYTPFGNLTKDMLYWSTMGTSYFFSVAMGIIEVITAVLILIKSTRIAGLIIAIGVFVNIILINFAFDISVKTFALFLLLATLFPLFPYLKKICNFLILRKQEQIIEAEGIVKQTKMILMIKVGVVSGMLFYVLFPYLESGNFNDDKKGRIFLHGAYQVEEIIKGKDTINKSHFQIKNIFVHRNSYMIFQGDNNQMTDYYYEIDTINKKLLLSDYQKNMTTINYTFSQSDSTLILDFDGLRINAKAQNWKKLPALQDSNHYFIDDVN